jgi:hypothetical protein
MGVAQSLLGGLAFWFIGGLILYGVISLWDYGVDYFKRAIWKNPTPLGFTLTQWTVVGTLLAVVSFVWLIIAAAVAVLSHRH